jgi:Ca2+-transporting ATPase
MMSIAPLINQTADGSLPAHALSIAEVFQTFATRAEGLTQTEAQDRLRQYGPNIIQEAKPPPLYRKLLANFTHLMAILLWVGGAMAFIAGIPQLGVAVWLVVIINGLFSFWQEYKAEKATEALRRLLPTYAHVLRDGAELRIPASELAPGDLMLLTEGDAISADGRLVQAAELRVDQSTLSGEAHPVHKSAHPVDQTGLARVELTNLVFAGTTVAAGSGRAVVFATGMASEFGKIATMTQTMTSELSPLQREIAIATRQVSIVAVTVGVIFFVISALLTPMGLTSSFIFALGMIVAFVPEGLLPTVTLSLAMGVQRMVGRHALVKRLSSVETLGCTSVICTDKTGTLTQNEMTVRELWVAGRQISVTGVGYAVQGDLREAGLVLPTPVTGDLRDLLVAAGLCNNARILPPHGDTLHGDAPHSGVLGDPTEAALLVAAAKAQIDLAEELRCTPRVREAPFESGRKRMSTIHAIAGASADNSADNSATVAFVKGAPRELLALCTSLLNDGRSEPLTDALRSQIVAANDAYARSGLRVLAVARRTLTDALSDEHAETVERDLTFIGMCAMLDPPRPEVAAAVETCHHAGIRIIMITGDYGLTAESIARRIGIIRTALPRIFTGADLDGMADEALKTVLQDEVIFARVSPEHKLRIVRVLQELGHVVAVTGDGVNDAPALKQADIGVAMGLTGSDVAKEAADMILTDDNFASIVNAVEEGRAVYANIKKFTSYILTSNTPEAAPFILFALTGGRIPLAINIMQVLAIDLGTDIVPALALGVEPPEPGVMARPPRSLGEHVINGALLRRAYLWLGPLQSVAVMTAFYAMYWTHGYWGQWLDLPDSGAIYQSAAALAFGAVVFTQIGNLFGHRTERISALRVNPFSNPLIWLGIAVELALMCLLIYVPFFRAMFNMAPFPALFWLFLLAWTPSLFVMDEVRKVLLRWGDRRRRMRDGAHHSGLQPTGGVV